MNSIFNRFFQENRFYIYIILFAYIVASLISLFLPKSGVDFLEDSTTNLIYKKYEGFYTNNVKVTAPKTVDLVKSTKLETLSKYTLKAIYSTTLNGGWIIVENKSSKKSMIIEKDEKLNGHTLIKLYKNFVIFQNRSKEYKLELPKEKEVNYQIESKTGFIKETIVVNQDSVTVNRKYLNSYTKNIDKVWKDIAIQEIRINEKIEGFKVTNVNKNSVFSKLGLKVNDLIKSVNGNELKSYADVFKVYNNINKIDYLTLNILRNNEIVELNYEID